MVGQKYRFLVEQLKASQMPSWRSPLIGLFTAMSKDGEPVEEEAHGPSYIAISKIGSMLKVVHFNGRYGSFTHYKVLPNAWGDD